MRAQGRVRAVVVGPDVLVDDRAVLLEAVAHAAHAQRAFASPAPTDSSDTYASYSQSHVSLANLPMPVAGESPASWLLAPKNTFSHGGWTMSIAIIGTCRRRRRTPETAPG